MWLQYNTSKPLFQAFSEILSRLCHNFYAPSKFSPQPLVSHPNFQGVLIPRTLFPPIFSISRRRFSQNCPPHAHFPHPPTGFPQAPLRCAPPKEKASGSRGSKFPAGRNKVAPSPYPPPKGGGWLVGALRPLPLPRGRLVSGNRGASARPS